MQLIYVHQERETRFDVFRDLSTGQWYLETNTLLVKIDEATYKRIAKASKKTNMDGRASIDNANRCSTEVRGHAR